jgi:hypothetical protein
MFKSCQCRGHVAVTSGSKQTILLGAGVKVERAKNALSLQLLAGSLVKAWEGHIMVWLFWLSLFLPRGA